MYCVSLDPGGTTGVCLVRQEQDPWAMQVLQLGPEDHHKRLFKLLTLWKPEIIICEGWDNRDNMAAQPTPLEYIGIVKLYDQTSSCQVVFQSAYEGKVFWSDDKLRKYDVWAKGLRHARDACRHYLYWRTFTLKDQALLAGKAKANLSRV
jgi:hypothetical protein